MGTEGVNGDTSRRRDIRSVGDRSLGGGSEGNTNSASSRGENAPQGEEGTPGQIRGRTSTDKILKEGERDSCSLRV